MSDYHAIVLGTGGAGLKAALEMTRMSLRVLCVTKGAAKSSGATPSALFSYCCPNPEDPENTLEAFRVDMLKSGVGVNDPEMVDLMCRDGFLRFKDLTALGMPWTREAGGEMARAWLPGYSVPRAFYADRRTGKALSVTLFRACLEEGVSFAQYKVAMDLVTNEGVIVVDLLNGETTVWPCDTVIVATGGAVGIYRLHSNPPGQTGDGMAMVLRAGGELVDMEFIQYYPTVLVYPPAAYGIEIPTGTILKSGARLLNRHGEEFFNRWEGIPVGEATRDILSRGIAKEIAAGGATEAGGVYLDAHRVPEQIEQDRHMRFLRHLGVDPVAEPQQVAPGAHFSMGGVRVNPPSTCVGLRPVFAAGECVGGLHGANRLAGNALPETQVFGALAAREAFAFLGRRGSSASGRRYPADPLPRGRRKPRRGESSLWDALCDARRRSEGVPLAALRADLREVVQGQASVIRTASGLEEALIRLGQLRHAFYHRVTIPDRARSWRLDLLEGVEVANLLEVARAVLASAWARRESRGSHYREDFPETDPSWDCYNLIVKGVGDDMRVIRFNRVTGEGRQVWP